jgi:hypothetical protein
MAPKAVEVKEPRLLGSAPRHQVRWPCPSSLPTKMTLCATVVTFV